MTGHRSVNIPWERPTWQHRAACLDVPGVNFFPERGESSEPAKRICLGCPVRVECARYVDAHPQPGVWAGLSENERLRRRRFRAEVES